MEILAGAGILWKNNQPELNLIHREEICEVELLPKTAVESGKAEEQDIYGIRLDFQAMEVQFYHKKDSVRD